MKAYKVLQKKGYSTTGLKRESSSCSKGVCQRANKKAERTFYDREVYKEQRK